MADGSGAALAAWALVLGVGVAQWMFLGGAWHAADRFLSGVSWWLWLAVMVQLLPWMRVSGVVLAGCWCWERLGRNGFVLGVPAALEGAFAGSGCCCCCCGFGVLVMRRTLQTFNGVVPLGGLGLGLVVPAARASGSGRSVAGVLLVADGRQAAELWLAAAAACWACGGSGGRCLGGAGAGAAAACRAEVSPGGVAGGLAACLPSS